MGRFSVYFCSGHELNPIVLFTRFRGLITTPMHRSWQNLARRFSQCLAAEQRCSVFPMRGDKPQIDPWVNEYWWLALTSILPVIISIMSVLQYQRVLFQLWFLLLSSFILACPFDFEFSYSLLPIFLVRPYPNDIIRPYNYTFLVTLSNLLTTSF